MREPHGEYSTISKNKNKPRHGEKIKKSSETQEKSFWYFPEGIALSGACKCHKASHPHLLNCHFWCRHRPLASRHPLTHWLTLYVFSYSRGWFLDSFCTFFYAARYGNSCNAGIIYFIYFLSFVFSVGALLPKETDKGREGTFLK